MDWTTPFPILEGTLEIEERELKAISKLMAELEEEMKRCYSDRTSEKYSNMKERMKMLTQILAAFKPGKPVLELMKTEYNRRLDELWKDFESRSDTLVENLQQQTGAAGTSGMGETGPSRRFEENCRSTDGKRGSCGGVQDSSHTVCDKPA